MLEGDPAGPRRLPFHFEALGGIGRLALEDLVVGPVVVDRLELEVTEHGTDAGHVVVERYQRRRTRLRTLALRLTAARLEERVEVARRSLAGLGISPVSARLDDGFIAVRARVADGLAAADLSFRVYLTSAGTHLRALASTIRVHGHLPTPGPVLADRILVALLGATDAPGVVERPHVRGLCDIEIDLVGAVLWNLLPPAGWRLPAVADLELVSLRLGRGAIEASYGPAGSRVGELGIRPHTHQLAAAHDLMHSADHQLREGHIEDAMRGYRALLASGGPEQPLLLERILALAAARPAWFFDGLELSRQALGRWPRLSSAVPSGPAARSGNAGPYESTSAGPSGPAARSGNAGPYESTSAVPSGPGELTSAVPSGPAARSGTAGACDLTAAHAALASITLAQGDAREAAGHLASLAQLAASEGDDDQAALAALAGARLLRVLEPRAATQLYELALEHDPSSAEAADSLADRLADEQRWPELVRLVRARAVITSDPARAVQLRLRLADVFVHQLGDPESAQQEVSAARQLAPEDPAVHEMAAIVLAAIDPAGALEAWREVARLAEARDDHRTCARAWAIAGTLLAGAEAEDAWHRALALDPLQAEALTGLAAAAAARDEHAIAAELYERLRELGLPPHAAARHELERARSLVALGRLDDARASLRRATLAGGEMAAEAHAVLAEVAEAAAEHDHAAVELEAALGELVELAAREEPGERERLITRAAQLAIARARLLDRRGETSAATAGWLRAHELAVQHAPELAREAAHTMLARAGDDAASARRWIDAVLATRPPVAERADLLVRRAEVHARERVSEPSAVAAATSDLREALALADELAQGPGADAEATALRRRAFQLEAELLVDGDPRARAGALAALADLAAPGRERVEAERAAAAAWLLADDATAALPHATRAFAELGPEIEAALRHDVVVTFGEAAWRQRAWSDVIRAYQELLAAASPPGVHRYRLAVAADRSGDAALALATLRPLVDELPTALHELPSELRGPALRLFGDLAERSGELAAAAAALEHVASLGSESSETVRADAAYRAGELFRRADRGDDAIRCLEHALRITDTHTPALDALELAWRERGDLERVSVILGRKVAATARQPARQKPLLSRLGELQHQLGRPDVALATHQRALEIDPTWRPSLRYVTAHLQATGQLAAAAGGLAQLASELPGDTGLDLAELAREQQAAVVALAELVTALEEQQLDAVRAPATPILERAAAHQPEASAALARLRGTEPPRAPSPRFEEDTASGRAASVQSGALSLREAASRARRAGRVEEALATLETANHVSPGDPDVLDELVELATELGDHAAAATHLSARAELERGAPRGNLLLELAELYYDHLDDPPAGREALRAAAEAFGHGARRDATLRMLASEARAHLAWDAVVEALSSIADDRQTAADLLDLATALLRAGRDGDALALIERASSARRLGDGDGDGLLEQLRAELDRKAALVRELEERAQLAPPAEAAALREEAGWLETSLQESRVKTLPGAAGPAGPEPAALSSDAEPEERAALAASETVAPEPARPRALARIKLVSIPALPPVPAPPEAVATASAPADEDAWVAVLEPSEDAGPVRVPRGTDPLLETVTPSVEIVGTPEETALAVALAAASANRELLIAAHQADPADAAVLLAVLAHLADEPALRREILEQASKTSHGPALAIALHELALLAREAGELVRAAALWTRAHEVDASYAPVWMPLADALAASDEVDAARELYERIAESSAYDEPRRAFAAERAAALGRDASIVSGEIGAPAPPPREDLATARQLADAGDVTAAIAFAERAAAAAPADPAPLELLELLHLRADDLTAASEAIERQLALARDDVQKAALWRRRARMYRGVVGHDAEAYRCLEQAHACAPADPEIAYQLRIAAMVRGEWTLAASLLYREIAAATNPRDRGALHLELALIYGERLDDHAQAQLHLEQALAFDPSIPAARPPLARRYEALGRYDDAAKLYEEAALTAQAADRAVLIDAANRCRFAASEAAPSAELAAQLVAAEQRGDLEAVAELARTLWRGEPGHPDAFRVLANAHRAAGDLAALSELASVRASRAETPAQRAAAWIEVARLADELGEQAQAARAYDQALVDDPTHAGALDARGALAFALGDFATADAIYRELSAADSALATDELALRCSIISEKLGRDSEALAQAQLAADAAPSRRDLRMRVQELATRIGDLPTALAAAHAVLDLVPLDDEEAMLAAHFALVELMRETGDLDGAAAQLERVLREHPLHAPAVEALADIHAARGDWATATRYLYQLVPLAPTAELRAERLYRLGEAVLVHLDDVDRADDIFLRASDLDPAHIPTLRRLLDVYWRADDPGSLVDVATELADKGALTSPAAEGSLAHALIAAALVGDTQLAALICDALGDNVSRRVVPALCELVGREGRLRLASATTAISELVDRGLIDLAILRAAAQDTPVAALLGT